MGPKSIGFNILRVRKEPEVKQRPTSWARYSMGNTNVVGEQAAYPCASIFAPGETNHCCFYLWDFGRSQNWGKKKQAAIIGKMEIGSIWRSLLGLLWKLGYAWRCGPPGSVFAFTIHDAVSHFVAIAIPIVCLDIYLIYDDCCFYVYNLYKIFK